MPLKREMSPGFCSGGAFSLDGSQLASTLIEAINVKYGAEVPVVNIGTYGAVAPRQEVNCDLRSMIKIKTPDDFRRFFIQSSILVLKSG